MSFFLINKSRLMYHIEQDVRKHARGVLNWWIEVINDVSIINITLHVQGVNYIYRQPFKSKEEIGIEITSLLTSNTSVLGYSDMEETQEPVQVIPPSGMVKFPSDFLSNEVREQW